MRPRCIILDESTAMLDPNGRKEVMETVKRLNKQEKITIIIITHFMEEAVDADKVVVMDHGKIVMEGKPKEIFSDVDKLKELSLDVPQVTEVCHNLYNEGFNIRKDILTIEEMAVEICNYK